MLLLPDQILRIPVLRPEMAGESRLSCRDRKIIGRRDIAITLDPASDIADTVNGALLSSLKEVAWLDVCGICRILSKHFKGVLGNRLALWRLTALGPGVGLASRNSGVAIGTSDLALRDPG